MDIRSPIAADDALAQPTRARLFALLVELRRPAGTVELAHGLELHPNGVRVHLERMEQAGLVVRARAPRTRAAHVGASGDHRLSACVASPDPGDGMSPPPRDDRWPWTPDARRTPGPRRTGEPRMTFRGARSDQ